jgi:hypothetical protein
VCLSGWLHVFRENSEHVSIKSGIGEQQRKL